MTRAGSQRQPRAESRQTLTQGSTPKEESDGKSEMARTRLRHGARRDARSNAEGQGQAATRGAEMGTAKHNHHTRHQRQPCSAAPWEGDAGRAPRAQGAQRRVGSALPEPLAFPAPAYERARLARLRREQEAALGCRALARTHRTHRPEHHTALLFLLRRGARRGSAMRWSPRNTPAAMTPLAAGHPSGRACRCPETIHRRLAALAPRWSLVERGSWL